MGRALAAALGLKGAGKGFIRGEKELVTWCVGHLVEAENPEAYDPALKNWRLDLLPILPDEFRFHPIQQTRDQFEVVQRLMNDARITEVVNATDAGREGELIFDLVYRLAKCDKPVLRLWTSSLTDEAIREAYAQVKPAEAYAGLRDAARCRQEADWLVGINCTRAQTLVARMKGGDGVYSIGRVQTPTLAMLVNRELEIRAFVPKEYWTLRLPFTAANGTFVGKWGRKGEDGKPVDSFATGEEARAVADKVKGKEGRIAAVQEKEERRKPELLYDLTSLQQEANKRFGFTAEHTLEVAQSLYEAKVLSYPRTNSRYLTKAEAERIPVWLRTLERLPAYAPLVAKARSFGTTLGKRFVDDEEVEDHTALVPTQVTPEWGKLSADQQQLYDLVARRFLAAFFPEKVEAKTAIYAEVEGEFFKATGTVVKDPGWTEADPPAAAAKKAKRKGKKAAASEDGEEDDDAGALPKVEKGEKAQAGDPDLRQEKTKPPKRFTEADLLNAMKTAGRDLDDEALRGAMKDAGLGTPATRAAIIETLLQRQYVERQKKSLVPTEKGVDLVQGLKVEALKSPLLTGQWEARMEAIRRGEHRRELFMERVRKYVSDLVEEIRRGAPKQPVRRAPRPGAPQGEAVGTCPKCKATLHLREWDGRHYVRCAGECFYGFDCDAEGKPTLPCPRCQGGKLKTTPKGRVCADCGQWDDPDRPAAPETKPCERCGQPLKAVWSPKKSKWFLRCDPCNLWLEPAPPAAAPAP